jgi:hypothetical protein
MQSGPFQRELRNDSHMRELSELNINEGGRPVSRTAPTEALFAEFESKTGMRLPVELRGLLQFANGGHPELDSVGGSEGQFAVNAFYHLTPDDFGPGSLWYAVAHWTPTLGERSLPFAADAGGNQFFLDLSSTPTAVKLCVHDEAMRIVCIAPSFEAFIDSLEIDTDTI